MMFQSYGTKNLAKSVRADNKENALTDPCEAKMLPAENEINQEKKARS